MRGSRAEVIRPNCGDDTLLFGALKFTLLRRIVKAHDHLLDATRYLVPSGRAPLTVERVDEEPPEYIPPGPWS